MNLFSYFETQILNAIEHLKTEGVLAQDVICKGLTVEPTRDASHGDVATNVAMVLAKPAQMKPRDIAEKIVEKLKGDAAIAKIDIAGPGFINLTLKNDFWPKIVENILSNPDYGRSGIGQNQHVNVEYVSANPTGPMHVGHCRGAIFGDALASLLEFAGFKVTREYYINDAGAQVDVLARSAFLRYREALGEDIGEIPAGLYPGDYLIPIGKALTEEYGQVLLGMEESDWLPTVREAAIKANMATIKEDLAALNIKHDIFFSEKSLTSGQEDKVAATIQWLKDKGLIYEGRLPAPKGKQPDDWEDREQTLFRATDFGDDVDRALIKSDGSYTYFAADMAYHRDKFLRGFTDMINVWGADHSGYIPRMKAAVKALTEDKAQLDVKICQLVNLFRDGEQVKMSKRAGTFVTLRDVVNEVGSDSTRFIMLYRKNDAVLDFDFNKVLEQSRDNPVFYVQYAHARIYSVFRNAHDVFSDIDSKNPDLVNKNLGLLTDEAEITLMKRLAQFPRVVEAAAFVHEPHRIAFFVYDIASDFHSLWNRGKESPQLRFINEDNRDLTDARLALLFATAKVLATGLNILGVKPKSEMR